ncbi:MAG: redoxin domain-containing protein [Patescibacteria group bacterium]|nr:redoxin domain-containing protein [Patescibacteria group bacterium]
MPLAERLAAWLTGRREPDLGHLPIEGHLPEFDGLTGWFNSEPLTRDTLKGRVVLVDFWTHSCVNCQRTLAYLNAWHEAYSPLGLVIIGVHTPEFDFEKDAESLRRAIEVAGIRYPVAADNDYALWNAYGNRYWPAHYFADHAGNLRHHQFGESGHEQGEAVIRSLLAEAGAKPTFPSVSGQITENTDFRRIKSPETYLGFNRMEYLGSPETVRPGVTRHFSGVPHPAKNVFYLEGLWEMDDEWAAPAEPGATLAMRFDAARVFIVAVGPNDGATAELTIDGEPPLRQLGADAVNENGRAIITFRDGRLYRLFDAGSDYGERTLCLTFREPGTRLYALTFG